MLITTNVHGVRKAELRKIKDGLDTEYYVLALQCHADEVIEITLFPPHHKGREDAIQNLDNLKVQTDVQSNL